MRKLSHSLLPSFLALLAFGACGDDTMELTFAALVGDWDVVEGLYVDAADSANQVNLEEVGGAELTMSIHPDQTWTVYRGGTEGATQHLELHGDTLTVDGYEFRVRLSGGDLTLTGQSFFPYDFDGDGTDEAAYTVIRARRQ